MGLVQVLLAYNTTKIQSLETGCLDGHTVVAFLFFLSSSFFKYRLIVCMCVFCVTQVRAKRSALPQVLLKFILFCIVLGIAEAQLPKADPTSEECSCLCRNGRLFCSLVSLMWPCSRFCHFKSTWPPGRGGQPNSARVGAPAPSASGEEI